MKMVELVEPFANSGDPDQKQPMPHLTWVFTVCHLPIYLSISISTPLSIHYLFFKRYELTWKVQVDLKTGTS